MMSIFSDFIQIGVDVACRIKFHPIWIIGLVAMILVWKAYRGRRQ